MPADTVIRPAGPADGETLLALVDALADYESLPRPDAAARERLLAHALGPQPCVSVLMAERQGRPVGYALYFFTYSSFLARPTLYLEDIFVLPEHRRAGVGRALMGALASEALARDCGRMEWQVLDWNEPAMRFYQRLGGAQLREWLPYRLERAQLEALGHAPER